VAVDDAGAGYAAELETLGRLGVSLDQGYLLGRPAPALIRPAGLWAA
jgi:EAL domain-containing protein (putative c-di-GMP-specific phosphodiesterase class I)